VNDNSTDAEGPEPVMLELETSLSLITPAIQRK